MQRSANFAASSGIDRRHDINVDAYVIKRPYHSVCRECWALLHQPSLNPQPLRPCDWGEHLSLRVFPVGS
jgi:hypothetical protein